MNTKCAQSRVHVECETVTVLPVASLKLKKGHESRVSNHEQTYEVDKDTDEPSPEVTVEEIWCTAVQRVVEDTHFDCTKKLHVSSEHRDKTKVTTNIETGQNSRNVATKIAMGRTSLRRGTKNKT